MAIQIQITTSDRGSGNILVNDQIVPLEAIGEFVQFITMADEIVCPICASHHREVNKAEDFGRPMPQLHRKCRCIEQPFIKKVSPDKAKQFEQMKIWLDGNAPEQADWSPEKLAKYQKDLLGKGVNELVQAGEIAVEQIVDKADRVRTLKVLQTQKIKPVKEVVAELSSFGEVTARQVADWNTTSKSFDKYLRTGGVQDSADLKRIVAKNLDARIAKLSEADQKAYQYFTNIFGVQPIEGSQSAGLVHNWAGTSGDANKLSIFLQQAVKEEFVLSDASMVHFSKRTGEDLVKLFETFQREEAMQGARVWLRQMYEETQARLQLAGINEVVTFRGASFSKGKVTSKMKSALAKRKVELEKLLDPVEIKKIQAVKLAEIKEQFPPGTKGGTEAWRAVQGETADAHRRAFDQLRDFDKGSAAAAIEEKVALQPMSSFSTSLDTANDFAYAASDIEKGASFNAVVTSVIPRERILSIPTSGFGCLAEEELVVLGGVDSATFAFTASDEVIGTVAQWEDAFTAVLK